MTYLLPLIHRRDELRGRCVVMGLLLLKERFAVFHRPRTASVSAL